MADNEKPRDEMQVGEFVIAFADLTNYHREICAGASEELLFEILSEYYDVARKVVESGGGQVLKFIGDAILIVFPGTFAMEAELALRQLRDEADALMASRGISSTLQIKAHIGRAALGVLGGQRDIVGIEVNKTAMLPRGAFVLSDEFKKRIGG
ncbi:MAG: adenylate/guanylate cyclase domain-containing protein [Planctomycetes bacterium]|nr:adenylate/guanylate cyclase domain-containing protein [Planctomycetota bacterium]